MHQTKPLLPVLLLLLLKMVVAPPAEECPKGPSPLVRLVGGDANYGRVEVRKSTGDPWGTICTYGFYDEETNLICGLLCRKTPDSKPEDPADDAMNHTSPIHISGLSCPENATSLDDCEHSTWGKPKRYCNHGNDAYIDCGGDDDEVTAQVDREIADAEPVFTCTAIKGTSNGRGHFTFPRLLNPKLKPEQLMMKPAYEYDEDACDFKSVVKNQTIEASFVVGRCGGLTEANDTYTRYTDQILRTTEVTGKYQEHNNLTYTVFCSMSKGDKLMSGGLIGRKFVTVAPEAKAGDVIQTKRLYAVEFFHNKRLTDKIVDQKMTLNKRIYVRITVLEKLEEKQMNLRNCWATESNDTKMEDGRQLIKDGCPAYRQVSRIRRLSEVAQTFSFLSFSYVSTNSLFIKCKTSMCAFGDQSANCRASCRRRRRRRGRGRRRGRRSIPDLIMQRLLSNTFGGDELPFPTDW